MWWGAAIVVVGWLVLAMIISVIIGRSARIADDEEGVNDVR